MVIGSEEQMFMSWDMVVFGCVNEPWWTHQFASVAVSKEDVLSRMVTWVYPSWAHVYTLQLGYLCHRAFGYQYLQPLWRVEN